MVISTAILGQMPKIGKPQKKFLSTLFNTMFCITGRYNFSNLSRYSSYNERSFRRWFVKAFDFIHFNFLLIRGLPSSSMIAAIDASAFTKSGRKTFGKGRFWSGSMNKIIQGIEISCIALVHLNLNTAFNLSVRQTNGQNSSDGSRIDQYLQQFIAALVCIKKYTRFLVADGFYAKRKFVTAVTNRQIDFISKLRHDANLRWPFTGNHSKKRGRRKKYDGKVAFKNFKRFDFITTLNDHLIYQARLYSITFQRTINVVAIVDPQTNKYMLLFCTDLKMPAIVIIQYYQARFQIEFLFRDAKQHTGLTHCQSRNEKSLHTHFNVSLSSVNIAKFDLLRATNFNPEEHLSIDNYKRRKANEHRLNRIISMLDLNPDIIKIHPNFNKLLNFGSLAA